jgi:hypothetical protein
LIEKQEEKLGSLLMERKEQERESSGRTWEGNITSRILKTI